MVIGCDGQSSTEDLLSPTSINNALQHLHNRPGTRMAVHHLVINNYVTLYSIYPCPSSNLNPLASPRLRLCLPHSSPVLMVTQNPTKLHRIGTNQRRLLMTKLSAAQLNTIFIFISLTNDIAEFR